jgi:hypothetical protein
VKKKPTIAACQGCDKVLVIFRSGICYECYKAWDELDRRAGSADQYLGLKSREKRGQKAKEDEPRKAKAKPKPIPAEKPKPAAPPARDKASPVAMSPWEMLGRVTLWMALSQRRQQVELGRAPHWLDAMIDWVLEEAVEVGLNIVKGSGSAWTVETSPTSGSSTAHDATATCHTTAGAPAATEP